MIQTVSLISKDSLELANPDTVKDIIYTILAGAAVLLLLWGLIYVILKYICTIIYRLIYRNYIETAEEGFVVIDVRVYGRKDERLIVENDDFDRFIIFEHKYLIAVTGDVLTGYKEVNTKTGKIRYYYNKVKVFQKKE